MVKILWVGLNYEYTCGKIVKNLIDEGGQLGVSSRGMGSVGYKERQHYVGGKRLLFKHCWHDIVADLTATANFVEGIMENKEWVWDNGVLNRKILKNIKSIYRKQKLL